MSEYKKCSLPFTIENFESNDIHKVSDEVIASTKTSLMNGFQSGQSLFGIASQVATHLEKVVGGFWLCNIKPAEVESGLIKCEY